MGNESSLIRKCQIAGQARHTTPEWSLFDVSHTNQKYSLIVFNEDVYFNDIARWKHVRHPNLVKCYEAGLNKAGKKCILVEPIEPISDQLKSMHSSRILSGLYSIGEALSFLHQRCGLSVNNLSIHSLFVSQKDCEEQWKLGSLYWYSSLDSDSEEFFKQLIQYHLAYNSIHILPPEDREIQTHQLIRSSKLIHRRDSHAFTELLQSLLTKASDSSPNQQPDKDSVASRIQTFVQECSGRRPEDRLRIDEILLNKIFVNCSFLQMRQFFLNFSTHNSFEKERFFEGFIDRLRGLPNELLIVQVFKMIVTSRVIMSDSFIYNNVMPCFLIPNQALVGADKSSQQNPEIPENLEDAQNPPSLLDGHQANSYTLINGEIVTLEPILTEAIFQEHIVSYVSHLFCVHDSKIRILLLQYLPHYCHLLPKNHLRKVILPQILLGIKDSDSFLVSLTFRSLATLVDIFDVVTVLGGSKRVRIFTTEAPRSGLPAVANGIVTSGSGGKGDERDNVSVKSVSSNSSSLNFLNFKLQTVPSTERTSPDGDEVDGKDHKDHLQQLTINSSMNNLNLVEDDDEWPEWDNENGNDSSSQFETAVESFASSDTLNSGITNDSKTDNKEKIRDNNSVNNGFANGNGKSLSKSNIQTFDIKEIDFHESKAESDNLLMELEPVFTATKTQDVPLPVEGRRKHKVNKSDLKGDLDKTLISGNLEESSVVKNDELFVLRNCDDDGHSAWGNDDDELDLEIELTTSGESTVTSV